MSPEISAGLDRLEASVDRLAKSTRELTASQLLLVERVHKLTAGNEGQAAAR